jgi:hypothetical protein
MAETARLQVLADRRSLILVVVVAVLGMAPGAPEVQAVEALAEAMGLLLAQQELLTPEAAVALADMELPKIIAVAAQAAPASSSSR